MPHTAAREKAGHTEAGRSTAYGNQTEGGAYRGRKGHRTRQPESKRGIQRQEEASHTATREKEGMQRQGRAPHTAAIEKAGI